MTDHVSALKDIVGEAHVLTEPSDKVAYEEPWRGDKGLASFVVRPRTTEEVSQVVAYMTENNVPFIAQSGNTGLVYGSTPDQNGTQAVLSLNRLTDIFSVNASNRSVHVGAGARLSAVNEALEPEDQFVPIDLGSDPCLGGMVSTNTGGSRLLKYGGMRENTMGLKVVLRDGQF